MTTVYLLAWLRAFVVTQVIEVPIYMKLARTSVWRAFGASAITHPVLWFVIFPYLPAGYWTKLVVGELWAWLGEAVYLRWVVRAEPRLERAVLWSLVANGASLGIGTACRALFGVP